jgi:hypothetical protein
MNNNLTNTCYQDEIVILKKGHDIFARIHGKDNSCPIFYVHCIIHEILSLSNLLETPSLFNSEVFNTL